ncbi:SH3 domain-containing protein [Enterococcus casseliflavus]|uniref:SH3 domain-containing protein n=1 Tax=Enterococcus casseliflavus TaxID=37734 RepID=UPI000EABA313|nr:SH3 domain-containing protein [Enterococcus casseliflavus]AYJ44211.1 LysM peptidoglycan-binding domain-containing protein [Enterococcus casseliflavus]MCD4960948.1 SH3 domain-containing protein [Enterococcus casseliflavus]MDT2978872.1 SH3 domain-containing protein [Enterococcus casseliflavus]MDU3372362.1 SH3 domain-containing protein [Enterococcus casseliflavus]MDY2549743.1 SH3 domain-containing protein [Enterococcus casseliflavus]
MTIRKERRRLEKRLKRTQYTQKSITMATTLVAGSTFIPTLGHAAETATTETSNDLKVVEQTTNTTPETDSTPVEETTASTTAPVVTEETSETTEESGTEVVTEGSETATTESTTVASDEVLEADEVPSALSDLTSRALFSRATIDPAAFISQICGYATEVAAANDLYASVMMAQAILESGWGASTLTTTANNMFGIKGSYNGQYVTMDTYEDDGSGNYYLISAKFRKYPSLKESFEDNAYVLRNTSFSSGNYYYSGAWKSNTTSYTQATAWLQGRYATDTSYASKLNNLISTYNLTQYDTGSSNAGGGNSNETIVSDETAINQQMKTTSSMNIRSDASISASITGSLAANTTFTATATKTGTSVNGNTTWYKISGKGWVSGAYLTKVSTDSSNNNSGSGNTGSDNSNSGTTINKKMKTTEAMNIRSSASTSGSVVGSLSKGTTFTATSMKTGTSVNGNKNWYYVSGKGWVSGAYLTEVTNNNASEAEKEDNSSSINQKMKTTAALNVRSDASTSSRVVTTLGQGVTVTVTAKKNGTSVEGNKTWYYVSGKGWVSGAYLTTTSSSSNNSGSTTTNQKMKTTEILNVRSDASTSSSITGSLSKGATVTVTATKTGTTVNGTNKWYYVSGKGWVSGAYLTAASSGSSNTNTSSSSTKTHTVKSGDSLWSLAQKYNTSISQIASWNKINSSYTIYVGQKLIVSK